MNKQFLLHHQRRAIRGEIKNAIKNCHVKGLNSIMLNDDGAGNRIRLFHATKEHELWKTGIILDWKRGEFSISTTMNLAVHRHHCDITLIRLFGSVRNILFEEPIPSPTGEYYACKYRSKINGEYGDLECLPGKYSLSHYDFDIMPLEGVYLRSNELHTVHVSRHDSAAWIVIEGKEDINHSNICYTMNPRFDSSGLYSSMSKDEITEVFSEILPYGLARYS